MDIGHLTSIAQLACAYTLVLGGYSTFRIKREEDAETILDRAQKQLSEIIITTNAPQLTGEDARKITSFEFIEWHSTPLRLLNRHRSFASAWYHREKKKRQKRDIYRNLVLTVFGLLSLFLLFLSSLSPDYQINNAMCWLLAVGIWLPPLTVMGQILWEDRQLSQQIYGNPPDDRVNSEVRSKASTVQNRPLQELKKIRTSDRPFPGHVYALTNDINRRYRIFEEARWAEGN